MTTMIWNGEVLKTRNLQCYPRALRVGNFVLYRDEIMRVVTVQRDCPTIENCNRVFAMFTLAKRDGTIVPARNLCGQLEVWKVVR